MVMLSLTSPHTNSHFTLHLCSSSLGSREGREIGRFLYVKLCLHIMCHIFNNPPPVTPPTPPGTHMYNPISPHIWITSLTLPSSTQLLT